MSDWIEEGTKAPAFNLKTDSGKKVKLSEFAGSPVVIYFYPKDDTPGCTKEACAFRDRKAELQSLGAVVLGVSADTAESHAKFRDKYELNFPLLAETDHQVRPKSAFALADRATNQFNHLQVALDRSGIFTI